MDADLPILHSRLTDLLLIAQHSSPRRRRLSLAVEFAQDARDGHSAQIVPRGDKVRTKTRFIRSRAAVNVRRLLSIIYMLLIFFEPYCTSCVTTSPSTLIVEILLIALLSIDLILQYVELGLKRFVEKRWNLILIFVLLTAVVDIAIAIRFYPQPSLRFSRPLRAWIPVLSSKPLRRFAYVVVHTIPNIAHLFGCMLVVLFAYAVSGIALFQNGLYNDPQQIPFSTVQNFNDLPRAVLALTVLVTTENFPDILLPGLHERPFVAAVYFISFFVIGAWLFMSLVLAETYRYYRQHHVEKVSHDRAKEQRSLFCCYQMLTENSARSVLDHATFTMFLGQLDPTLSEEHKEALFHLLDKNHNNSIDLREFMFLIEILRYTITPVYDPVPPGEERERWRDVIRGGAVRAANIVSSKYFEYLALAVNVANAISLLMYSSDLYSMNIHILTWIFLGLMWVEMLFLVAAKGLPTAWTDRPIDLLLLICSIPAEIFLSGPALIISRSLRILRILPIWAKSRPLLETLRASSSILWHFLFILIPTFVFFAILGLEAFSLPSIGHPHDPNAVADEQFDNFWGACLALFQMATSNNWQNNLYPAVLDRGMWSSLFFVTFYFLINTVVINVFAANLISAYTLRRNEEIVLVRSGSTKFKVVKRHPWERAIISDEMPAFNSVEVASLRQYVQDLEAQIQAMHQENEHLRSRSSSLAP